MLPRPEISHSSISLLFGAANLLFGLEPVIEFALLHRDWDRDTRGRSQDCETAIFAAAPGGKPVDLFWGARPGASAPTRRKHRREIPATSRPPPWPRHRGAVIGALGS